MDDDSDDSDSSEISSSYSSDGAVLTSYGKNYDTSSDDEEAPDSIGATLAVPDGYICQEEHKEIMEIMISHPNNQHFQIYPNNVHEYLLHEYPHIADRLRELPRRDCSVAVASRSLLNQLDETSRHQRVPLCVLCDVCVFSRNEPVTVLTFTSGIGKVSKAVKYNSQLTRVIIQSIKSQTRYSFSAVYGSLPESMCHTTDSFLTKISQLEKDAAVMSIAPALDMTPAKCEVALKAFFKIMPVVNNSESPPSLMLDQDR